MDNITIAIFVSAVIFILFLFVFLFYYIIRLHRKAKLLTKIALMENSAPEGNKNFGTRKSSIKRGKHEGKNNN